MNVSFEKWQEQLETGIKNLSEGNYVQAEEYLLLSLSEAEALDVPIIIAFSQRLLATAQVKNNKLIEAESGFKRALEYCRLSNNRKGIAEGKAGLAGIHFIKGEYPESINLYKLAIDNYPPDASPLRLAVLYSDLAQVYARIKNWKKAKACLIQSRELCQDSKYWRGIAEIDLYLGEIYYCQGKNQAAQESFLKAARIFSLIEDLPSLANTHQYLAFILMESNRIEEALLYQNRVISLQLNNKLYKELSEGYFLFSYILQYAKLLDEAEECLKLSLKYYEGHDFGLAVRYHCLAVIAVMKKEYEKAKDNYFQALKFFQYYGDGPKIGEISEELTYLIKYEDSYLKDNLNKWLGYRLTDSKLPKHEVMLSMAINLKQKGNDLAALRCGWKAMEIVKGMSGETHNIESLVQNLSERIRKKNKRE